MDMKLFMAFVERPFVLGDRIQREPCHCPEVCRQSSYLGSGCNAGYKNKLRGLSQKADYTGRAKLVLTFC
jgi:hypothetical protein